MSPAAEDVLTAARLLDDGDRAELVDALSESDDNNEWEDFDEAELAILEQRVREVEAGDYMTMDEWQTARAALRQKYGLDG